MVNVASRRLVSPPVVLAATLGLATACWAVAAWLMDGMDMGVATRPGSFGFFAAAWVTMMAAMMLPGAAPASPGTSASAVRRVPRCRSPGTAWPSGRSRASWRTRWTGRTDRQRQRCNDKKATRKEGDRQ